MGRRNGRGRHYLALVAIRLTESRRENRTIIVSGGTGSGKSTLINGMINYILGVQWEDSYRFKLVDEDQWRSQSHSQTSEVTVYKINHQEGFKINHSLTIIDTPGFGDRRGIKRDKLITEQLQNLFSAYNAEIDAVCFVVQSALARLTSTQKYMFDSALSMFDKDVAENIQILVTFADIQQPPVLEAIKASSVPCPKTDDGLPVHFKFNNSALFVDNKSSVTNNTDDDDEDGGFDEMFWNMGTKSMKRFFAALNVIKSRNLKLTKELLKERRQLEDSVESLQEQIKAGLAKMEKMRKLCDDFEEYKKYYSEIAISVMKPYKKETSGPGRLINCQQCHVTCGTSSDSDEGDADEGSHGFCSECPGRCHWSVHLLQKYKWEYKEEKEKATVKEVKEKCLNSRNPSLSFIFSSRKGPEYKRVEDDSKDLMKRSAECLDKLKEMSLRPDPLSTDKYIKLLIKGEQSEKQPGWEKRVEVLVVMI